MKTIDLPPYAPLLMESTRAIGYNLESALADILDNSIAASARKIDIRFTPYDDPYIAIIDNGCGMDKEKLINSMRYGSYSVDDVREEKDLGRFGLGMKTASLSQCRKLTVISKCNNEINACRWDLDHIQKTGKWSLICLNSTEIKKQLFIDELNNFESGTIISLQNVDKIVSDNSSLEDALMIKMEDVRNHLSLVFHRYLSGEQGLGKIKISINNNELKPIDPFLSNKSQQIFAPEELKIDNEKIIIAPYLLPHLNNMTRKEIEMLGGDYGLKKNQGFYVYRNKRLLIWGSWFRLAKQEELNKLARVKVDIPNTLDSQWTLDIKKSTASPPFCIRKNLRSITEKICEKSKSTWNFRGRRETSDNIEHLWQRIITREGVIYKINENHPITLNLLEQCNDDKGLLQLLEMIGKYLPLNQIYSDLSSDKKITNIENEDEIYKIDSMISKLLEMQNANDKQKYLNLLENIEPFNSHKEIIDRYRKEL
ncbi:ATP-binding protein [Clostridium botulinum]|nr:ATP-binding protein [Clostridium botulinum]